MRLRTISLLHDDDCSIGDGASLAADALLDTKSPRNNGAGLSPTSAAQVKINVERL
jgi:hypothetical protein